MAITGEQVRMLRGAFRMTVRDFASFVGVVPGTVVKLEAGGGTKAKTPAKIEAAFAPYVEFIEPDGECGPGIRLKRGYEAIVRGAGHDDATDATSGGLNARAWDEDESLHPTQPVPPIEWTDEDRAEQIAYWRGRPERWAALAEVSRQCLLRAMGVERL